MQKVVFWQPFAFVSLRARKAKQSFFFLLAFLVNTIGPLPQAQADELLLPVPGIMVALIPAFNPPILKGLKVNPENPFKFEFILDQGDAANGDIKPRGVTQANH
jgi:hypothetical protein